MAKTFQALREKTSKKEEDPEKEEKVKSAGVNTPLPSDDNELDDADENTRNIDGSAEDMVATAIKPIYKKRKDGSYSLNTEEAIQEDQKIVENVMDNLKKIITQHQASNVKFKDGTIMTIDATTANILLSVYGALNKNNQVKMAQTIAKDKAGFAKMSNFAFKQGRIASKMGLQGPSPNTMKESETGDKTKVQRARKVQKREVTRPKSKRPSGKTSDKVYDYLLRKSQGKSTKVGGS